MEDCNIKKLFLFFLILLAGCASYDVQKATQPENRVVYQKLPNMEPVFATGKFVNNSAVILENNNGKSQLNTKFATLFKREVQKNLVDANGPVERKLVLTPIHFEDEPNRAWLGTIIVPPIFGLPLNSHTSKWKLELNVLDRYGNKIARYSAEAEDTKYLAAYWEYTDSDTVAAFESYKKALDKIIKRLQKDIPTLSSKLR